MLAAAWSTMFVYNRPFFIAILSLLTGRRMGPAVKYGTILRCKISFFWIAGTLALWILAIPCGPVHRDVFRAFRQEQATQHTDNFESRHKSRQFRQLAQFFFRRGQTAYVRRSSQAGITPQSPHYPPTVKMRVIACTCKKAISRKAPL